MSPPPPASRRADRPRHRSGRQGQGGHSKAWSKDSRSVRAAPSRTSDALLARITPSADYADLKDCDLVIEAVFEDREVKKESSRRSRRCLKEGAIFASNTSTLPITGLPKNSRRPVELHRHPFLLAGREDDAGRRVIIGKKPATRRWPPRSIIVAPSRRRRSSSTTRAASSSTAASSAISTKPMTC
jgi:hypothetical protein